MFFMVWKHNEFFFFFSPQKLPSKDSLGLTDSYSSFSVVANQIHGGDRARRHIAVQPEGENSGGQNHNRLHRSPWPNLLATGQCVCGVERNLI